MSTNFWDAKIPEDEVKPVQQNKVEPVEMPDTEQSDKIQLPNPLKIQVDGKAAEFQLENQTELSYEAIRAIIASNEFWIIDLDQDRNSFFQMHIESGQIEYWTNGAMQHQQTGDIDDALKYLESIISTDSGDQIANVDVNDDPISASAAVVPTQQRIEAMRRVDVAKLASVETPEIHDFFSYGRLVLVAIIVSISTLLFFSTLRQGLVLGSFIVTTALFVLAYFYSTRTKIAHFKIQQTYVWYQGKSVRFIYVREVTDKLLTWNTTTTSKDSDGHTETTHHHHFRIIDASGGELFSGEDAGGTNRMDDPKGRDRLIELLGLETIDKGDLLYPPPRKHLVTGNTMRDLDNNGGMKTVMKGLRAFILGPILFVGTIAIFIFVGQFLGGDFGYDYEMPDRWCDESVNYPVTVPIQTVSETVMQSNREDGTYSDTDLVINGGICTYRYRTGGSSVFDFEIELQEVSDIDGISMLVMPHPGGQTVGYSGIEVYTRTDEGSPWEQQIDSPYMFGHYERGASHENYAAGFYFGEWFRHAFDSSVENVSHVKIVTGNADQLGDMSVSFSGLRVDAVGDYDYPDYLICSGEWDGLFENSTSDMIAWNPDGC